MNCFLAVWKNFGLVGSFVYLLIQVCFLILFADAWADNWVDQMEKEPDRNCPFISLISVSFLNYALSAIGLVLFYIYYGGDGCGLQKWLISINLIMIVALSVISILPKIQEC